MRCERCGIEVDLHFRYNYCDHCYCPEHRVMALFNLIPFAVFDRPKVYAWDRRHWAALFLISLALTVYANFILRPFS